MDGQSAAKLRSKIKHLIDAGIRLTKSRFADNELKILSEFGHSLSEACYMVLNDLAEVPKCPVCGKELRFRCLSLGYRQFCSCRCKNRYLIDNTDISARISKSISKYHHDLPRPERREQQNRRLRTMEARGIITPRCMVSDFIAYKRQVWRYTESTAIAHSSARSHEIHLDHMYSIFQGFKECIVPWVIGSNANLRLCTMHDNVSKNRSCMINKDELFKLYFEESSETIPQGSTRKRAEVADS